MGEGVGGWRVERDHRKWDGWGGGGRARSQEVGWMGGGVERDHRKCGGWGGGGRARSQEVRWMGGG